MTAASRLFPALVLALLLPLAACKPGAPAPAAGEPAAQSTPAAPAAPAAAPTEVKVDPAVEANAQQIFATALAGPALVEGTDYVTIPNGQPYEPLNGQVEVVEVFGYVCPACARFQPLMSAWKKKLPAGVRFSYVPAPFGGVWIPYAKAYYVAQQTPGLLDKTHDALFKAIHLDQTLKGERGQDSDEDIARFYAAYGVDPKQFVADMNSFGTEAKLNKGKQFMLRAGVEGTPTVIVNGKYRVKGTTYEDILRIATRLVAQEQQAAGSAPVAAPATTATP